MLVVDSNNGPECSPIRFDHLVRCSTPSSRDYFAETPKLIDFTTDDPHGQWIGLVKFSSVGIRQVRQAINKLEGLSNFDHMSMKNLFEYLLANGTLLDVMYVNGQWVDIDQVEMISGEVTYS